MAAREKDPKKDKEREYKETGGANNTTKTKTSAKTVISHRYIPGQKSTPTVEENKKSAKVKNSVSRTNKTATDTTGGANNTVKETKTGTYDTTKKGGATKDKGKTASANKEAQNNANKVGLSNPYQDIVDKYNDANKESKTYEEKVTSDQKATNPAVSDTTEKQISAKKQLAEEKRENEVESKRRESSAESVYSSASTYYKDKAAESAEKIVSNNKGNIDISQLPSYKIDRSITSYGYESPEYGLVLIPASAYVDGKAVSLSEEEAIARFEETGEFLGQFDSADEIQPYLDSVRENYGEYNKNLKAMEKISTDYADYKRTQAIGEGASEGQIAYYNMQQTNAINESLKAEGYSDEEILELWDTVYKPQGYTYTTASDVKKVWTQADSEALTYTRSKVKEATETEAQASKIRENLQTIDFNGKTDEEAKAVADEYVYNDDFWNYAIALANSTSYHTTDQQKDTQKIIDVLSTIGRTYLNEADWEELEAETGVSHDEVNKIYNVLTTREWGGKQVALGMLTSLPFAEQIIDANEKDEYGISFNTVDYLNGLYDTGTGYTTEEGGNGALVSDEAYKGINTERSNVSWAIKGGNVIGTTAQMMAMGIGAEKVAGNVTSKVVSALEKSNIITEGGEFATSLRTVMPKAIESTIMNTYMTATGATKKGYDMSNFGMDWLKGEVSFLAMTFSAQITKGILNKTISDVPESVAGTKASSIMLNRALDQANKAVNYKTLSNIAITTMKTAASGAVGATAGVLSPIVFMDEEEKEQLVESFGSSWLEMFALSFGMEMVQTLSSAIKGRAEYKKVENGIAKLIELEALHTEAKTTLSSDLFALKENPKINGASLEAYAEVESGLTSLFNKPETASLLSAEQKQKIADFFGLVSEYSKIKAYNMARCETAVEKINAMIEETVDLYDTNEATQYLAELYVKAENVTNEEIELATEKIKQERAVQEEAIAYLKGEIKDFSELSEKTRKALSDSRNARKWAELFNYDTDLSFTTQNGVDVARSNARARQIVEEIHAMNSHDTDAMSRRVFKKLNNGGAKNGVYDDNTFRIESKPLDDGKIEATITNKKLNITRKGTYDTVENAVMEARRMYENTTIRNDVIKAIEEKNAYKDNNIQAQVRKVKDGYKVTVDDININVDEQLAPFEKTVDTLEEAIDIITDYSILADRPMYDTSMPLSQTAKQLYENKAYTDDRFTATLKTSKKNGTRLEIFDNTTGKTESIFDIKDYNDAGEKLDAYISGKRTEVDTLKAMNFTEEEYEVIKDVYDNKASDNATQNKLDLMREESRQLTNVLKRIKDGSIDAGDIGDYVQAVERVNEYDALVANTKAENKLAKATSKLEAKLSKSEKKVADLKAKAEQKRILEKQSKIRNSAIDKVIREAEKARLKHLDAIREAHSTISKLDKITDKSQYDALHKQVTENIINMVKGITDKTIEKAGDIVDYFNGLEKEYPNINFGEDPVYTNAKKILDGKNLSELTTDELLSVTKAAESVIKLHKYATNKADVSSTATRYANEVAKEIVGAYKFNKVTNSIRAKTLTPKSLFEIVSGAKENSTFSKLFSDIRRGMAKSVDFRFEATEELTRAMKEFGLTKTLLKNKKYIDTGIEVVVKSDNPITGYKKGDVITLKMSPDQLIYTCIALGDSGAVRRMLGNVKMKKIYVDEMGEIVPEGTEGATKIEVPARDKETGGYRIPNEADWKASKYDEAYNNGVTVEITEDVLSQLPELLTTKERAFVEVAKKIYKKCGESADINMMDWRGRTVTGGEGDHVHLVDSHEKASSTENTTASNKPIKEDNQSIFKERTATKEPFHPDNIVRNLITEINQTGNLYVGKAREIYGKVLNEKVGGETVYDMIHHKFGSTMAKELNKIYEDSGITMYDSKLSDKILSKYANAVTAINLGTTLKQIASYWQLLSRFDASSVAKGIFKNPNHELVAKYSSAYRERMYKKGIKSMTSVGESAVDVFNNNLNLTSLTDLWTVRKGWGVAEEYVKSHYDTRGMTEDAYYKLVGRLYDEAIQETQPARNRLDKASILRSDSSILKAVTLFTGQPMQNWNLMNEGAIVKANLKHQNPNDYRSLARWHETTKQQVRTGVGQALSAMMLGAITTSNAFLRGNTDDWKDENGVVSFLPVYDENSGELITKGVLGEFVENSITSAINSIPFASVGTSSYNLITGKYSSDVLTMPQFEMANEIVTSLSTIYSGVTDGNQQKINRGIKDLALNVAQFNGVPAEYAEKVGNNALCQLNPEYNAWYQHTFYGTELGDLVDNPESIKYVMDEYTTGMRNTTAGEEIERIILNDEDGSKVTKMLNGKSYDDDFDVNGETITLTNEERSEYGDLYNKYYVKLANEFAESDGYINLDDEQRADAYNDLRDYAKAMAKSDIVESLHEKGKYKYVSASKIDKGVLDELEEEGISVSDYVVYKKVTEDYDTKAAKEVYLSGLAISDEAKMKIYEREFDDTEIESVMEKGDITAREYIRTKAIMSYYNDREDGKACKISYINDVFDTDKSKIAMYENCMEDSTTKEDNKISTAYEYGISPDTFMNREIQLLGFQGEKYFKTSTDVKNRNGKIVKTSSTTLTEMSTTAEKKESLLNSGYSDNEIIYFYQKENPSDTKFSVSTGIGVRPKDYIEFKLDTADYSGTGKKEKYIAYVNDMDISQSQKLVLLMMADKGWEWSTNQYQQVINYVIGLDMSTEEKLTAFDEMGFYREGNLVYPKR